MKETKKNSEKANTVVNANTEAATTLQTGKEKKTQEVKPTEKEQPKTAEQLQAELEEQQREIDRRTAELQTKLQELEEKQKLNRNRSKFIETLDKLAEFEKDIMEKDTFETNIFRVKFCGVENNYRETDLFSVSNVSILLDLIAFMRERINLKVAEIEQQLLK